MTEHVILVAFTVDTDAAQIHGVSRAAAEEHLTLALTPLLASHDRRSAITEWWVAEDDRRDGSDNDSAVFCRKGYQPDSSALLHRFGFTPAHNVIDPDDRA